ncbi:MAG TPA: peptidase M1, partial [Syntrophobacteraceae bacterium]|nr:peptidase M1 [Syntrophobacteraceae bacterium]
MRTLLLLLLLLAYPAYPADSPHLDLDLRLDPVKGTLDAEATLTIKADSLDFRLVPSLKVIDFTIDGRKQPLPPPDGELIRLALAGAGAHTLMLAYQGTLGPMQDLDQNAVLAHLPPMVDARGSFLPAGSGWYPDPGVPFSYRVHLHLPPGQKGLVAGNLVQESDRNGYQADYVFAHSAEGIDLMAGPYKVTEKLIPRPGHPPLRLRTWFYADMADLAPGYLNDSARYIDRYSKLIGPYPFDAFSVVASPLPTGFGMPGLTYLGREVLRLPFIRATSLGHEILHNWWGNGVIPDWTTGNWSEGLT